MNNISSIADGILVEQKGCGVAVHYRNAPLARRALESEVAAIVAASSYDLVLREGRKVLEAVPRGYSKGTALVAARRRDRRSRGAAPSWSATTSATSRRSWRPSGSAAWACAWRASTSAPRHGDFDGVDSVRAWLEAFALRLAAEGRKGEANGAA